MRPVVVHAASSPPSSLYHLLHLKRTLCNSGGPRPIPGELTCTCNLAPLLILEHRGNKVINYGEAALKIANGDLPGRPLCLSPALLTVCSDWADLKEGQAWCSRASGRAQKVKYFFPHKLESIRLIFGCISFDKLYCCCLSASSTPIPLLPVGHKLPVSWPNLI